VHRLKIWGRLFQLVVERGEHGDQIDTEALDDRDNGERDACGDQTIFNGGGAGFVSQKFKKNSLQFRILSGCATSRRCEPMPFRNLRLRKFRLVNFMTNHAADGDGWKRFNIDRKATRFVEEALARITDEQISDRHGRAEARSASSR
jgi:hypothetical protein